MITNLVSQQLEDWEMIEEGLCKNRVQFHVLESTLLSDFSRTTVTLHLQVTLGSLRWMHMTKANKSRMLC